MSDLQVQDVGNPQTAGDERGRALIRLIVLGDDPRPSEVALADYVAPQTSQIPHYYIDRLGNVSRLVDDGRAGRGLGAAIYQGFSQQIDPIALSLMLTKRPSAGYDGPQLRALDTLLADLFARHGLNESALARLVAHPGDTLQVRPYIPPPAPVLLRDTPPDPGPTQETEMPLDSELQDDLQSSDGILLGGTTSTPDPEELWKLLLAETYKPRAGRLHLEWAFTIFAAAKGLGAPVGPNPKQPLISGGLRYNFMPFARDTLYNIGTNYSDVRRLSDLLGTGAAIPAGLARDMLAASYRTALDAGAARGVTLSGNQNLNPGWKFHQVAKEAGLGPALSGNQLTPDRRYIVQVFAGDTLFTPVSRQRDCTPLSQIGPNNPAYAPIWAATYNVVPAEYDPDSTFQQAAAGMRLGAPLTDVYDTNLGGTQYSIQVFALDTLYRSDDGVVRRMSDLPLPDGISWPPGRQGIAPTRPQRLQIDVGPPRRNDPSWPGKPPFNFLGAKRGAVEAALGRIEWVPGRGDSIRITNGWDRENLEWVDVPQLRRFRLAGYGKVRFHKRAAAQLQQLFADWEAAGLLGLILTFDGAYNPRTIRGMPGVLSQHAYGAAFDINARWNRFMGQPALVGQYGSVRELVPIAYANGFYWGGHFRYRNGGHDGMHFEWAVDL
jgi:hypothetical protein